MGGIEATELIRQDQSVPNQPYIIALTAGAVSLSSFSRLPLTVYFLIYLTTFLFPHSRCIQRKQAKVFRSRHERGAHKTSTEDAPHPRTAKCTDISRTHAVKRAIVMSVFLFFFVFFSAKCVYINIFFALNPLNPFRHLHPSEQKFSYWSFRQNSRYKNVGWYVTWLLILSLSPIFFKKILLSHSIHLWCIADFA